MKKLYCLFFLCTVFTFAQNNEMDSLRSIISNPSTHDSIRTQSYYNLSINFLEKNKDSSLFYLNKLEEYSKQNTSHLGYYYYYKFKAGHYSLFIDKNENTLDFIASNLLKSLEFAEKAKKPILVSRSYLRLSQEYSRAGNRDKGKFYIEKAIETSEKYNIWEETAYNYTIQGENQFRGYNQTDKALQSLLKADSIYLSHDFTGDDRGINLSLIGEIYKELENLIDSEKYQNLALNIFKNNNNEYQEKYVLGNIASIERLKKNYDKSIKIFLECIAYYKTYGYKIKEAGFNLGLSEVYFDSNQINKAIACTDNTLKISKEINVLFFTMLGQLYKSKYLFEINAFEESYQLAFEANKAADQLSALVQKEEALRLLHINAQKLNMYDKAYTFAIEHATVKDSLLKNENIQKVEELETKYQNEKQQQEIELLTSKNELSEQQKANQRNLFLGGLALTTLAGLFFFFQYKNRQKTNKKLKELDKAKSNFFANISHEFRTPLTLIFGPIQQQLKNGTLDDRSQQNLQVAEQNSKRLLALVDQLLDISKIESGNLKLHVSKNKVLPFIATLAGGFKYHAEQQELNYEVKIDNNEGESWFDKDALEKIVVNLISNAIKYTSKKGSVIFDAKVKSGALHLSIKNTGKGLSESEMKHLFERFYQGNENNEGIGLGLSLVKELVELHKGQIHVESKANDTTTFSVTLPLNKSIYKENELILEESIISATAPKSAIKLNENSMDTLDNELVDVDEDVPIMLLVEDNNDVKNYIESIFKNDYKIVLASNGEEGILSAFEHIPDIVISDIMMPVKDGIVLSNTLKTDERTSHIPIILLTAKAGEEYEIKGVKTGADAYITKPFNEELLKLKTEQLILNRKQLRDRYSQELILKPKDIAINSIDEQFLERIQNVLDEHLTESNFSNEDFAREVGMSRMQLHRKIKALIGLSTSEFIRSQRLKLAAELLKKSDINISQIGYSVGFNDHAYFSKSFKEVYKCTPTEYLKNSK